MRIVDRIYDWDEEAEPIDLSNEDVGALRDAANELREEPVGADLFLAMWVAGNAACDEALVYFLSIAEDPGLLAEMTRIIEAAPREKLPPGLSAILLSVAARPELHAITRAKALQGVLYLAQESPALMRRLQAHLLELDLEGDGTYLAHAAKIMGFVLSHQQDEQLALQLRALLNVPPARSEAAFALGQLSLAAALGETDRQKAILAFEAASAMMHEALASSEIRADASLYALCIETLLRFHRDSGIDDVKHYVEAVSQAAFCYAVTTLPSDERSNGSSWMGNAALEGLRWFELASRLAKLEERLKARAWLNATMVIEEELLLIYNASRSILRRSDDGGIEAIIRPRISTSLLENRIQLATLEQWLEDNNSEPDSLQILSARAIVHEAMEASVHRHPRQAAVHSWAAADIVEKLPAPLVVEGRQLLKMTLADFDLEQSDPVLIQIWSSVVEELGKNSDYAADADARNYFNIVLYKTISFVISRRSLSASSIDGIAYLYNRDNKKPPLEKDLQKDYFRFLQATPLRSTCSRETNDLGSGRADIHFHRNGITWVAELKKTDSNHDLDGLLKNYGLQTTAYQRSSYTYCILMVLDLVDRGGNASHVREAVGVRRITPDVGDTTYSVVVCRVQGRLKSPHDL